MIAVDLRKGQAINFDHKAIQQIYFTENLHRAGNTRIYFILEETELSQTFHKELQNFCKYNSIKGFDFYQYRNDAIQQSKCKAIKFTP